MQPASPGGWHIGGDGDEQYHRYEQMVAEAIVREGLRRYEVLSETPLPPGSDLFSRAAYKWRDGSLPINEDHSG